METRVIVCLIFLGAALALICPHVLLKYGRPEFPQPELTLIQLVSSAEDHACYLIKYRNDREWPHQCSFLDEEGARYDLHLRSCYATLDDADDIELWQVSALYYAGQKTRSYLKNSAVLIDTVRCALR